MTIKISQLANLTVTQANTIVPVVSNITGTLTTVQANVQQLQDYIIANGVSANITALYTNAATQSDLIIGINANVVAANLGMKGYVDSVASQSIYGNSNVKSYLTGGFDGNILPSANVTYSLGDNTHRWKDLYLSGTTIFLGATSLSADATTGAIRSPVTRTLYNQSFLPGTANSANTYTLAYSQTPGSTVTVLVVGQQSGGPAPSYYLTEGVDFTISGLTLIVTASYTATSITCYETYIDTGDLLTTSEISTETVTPPSGDLTVDGNLVIDGDLTVSPTSIYMGNLRISAADGNLKVNTGIKFSDDSVQSTAYSNVKVATYLPTYSGNIANIRLGSSGVLTFADGTTQTTAGTYSNVQVDSYIRSGFSGTISGNLGVNGSFGFANVYVPSLANSAGIAGQITWSANYIYICTATNTWKRANISTW